MNLERALLFLMLVVLTCSFKMKFDWTQAWVDSKVLSESELPKSVLKWVKAPELKVVLMTRKDLITTPSNGNTYLRCYLINHTDTTAGIERSDATITGFSTEILKDRVWQIFQRDLDSGCGNSIWKQQLGRQQVLSIQLDHAEKGPIKVPFRIKYRLNDKVIYSNVIRVEIDKANYVRVGKTKT